MQQSKSRILTKRPYRFVLGLASGVLIGVILVSIFSGVFISQTDQISIGGVILSSMTYCGFALVLFGYFYKRGEAKNFTADFLLGVGIGLILVWFVGAGDGSIPGNGILY